MPKRRVLFSDSLFTNFAPNVIYSSQKCSVCSSIVAKMLKTRSQNYSVIELETILHQIELRPGLVSGKGGTSYKTVEEQKLAWQEIADAVNALDMAPKRSACEIKRKWADFKSRVKSKVGKSTLRQNITEEETTSLTATCLRLTPHEERALKLISTTSAPTAEAASDLDKSNLDIKSQKTQSMKASNNENVVIVHCKPVANDEATKSTRPGFDITDKSQATALSDSSEKRTNVLQQMSSTRLPLFQNKRTITTGFMYNSQNAILTEVKEVKKEIKELRESMRELVNIKKIALELKCLKYGVQFKDVSQEVL